MRPSSCCLNNIKFDTGMGTLTDVYWRFQRYDFALTGSESATTIISQDPGLQYRSLFRLPPASLHSAQPRRGRREHRLRERRGPRAQPQLEPRRPDSRVQQQEVLRAHEAPRGDGLGGCGGR